MMVKKNKPQAGPDLKRHMGVQLHDTHTKWVSIAHYIVRSVAWEWKYAPTRSVAQNHDLILWILKLVYFYGINLNSKNNI